VTPEMLVALPRTPRPQAAAAEGEEDDSIGTIFKEAREQRAADEQRRGGPRKGARSGGRGDGRGEPRARSGEGQRDRGPRPPRKSEAPRPATAGPAVADAAAGAAAQAFVTAPAAEGERAPRKRRRRRGGKRIEGAETGTVQHVVAGDASAARPAAKSAKPVHKPATPAAGAGTPPSLLARIGRGLKSLVTRAPRSQH